MGCERSPRPTRVITLAVLGFSGCSGASGPSLHISDGGVVIYPISQAALDYVESFCAIAVDCCGQLPYIRNKGDIAMSTCRQLLLQHAPAFDPATGKACLKQLQEQAQGQDSCLPISVDPRDPCVRAFQANPGHQKAGARCTSDLDCAKPEGGIALCAQPTAPGGGQCQQLIWGEEGQQGCGSASLPNGMVTYGNVAEFPTAYVCPYVEGIYCDFNIHQCVKQLLGGDACQSDEQCVSASCESSHTCAPQVAANGPCSGLCSPGYYCKNAQCAATIRSGNTCSQPDACTSGHCDNGVCTIGATFASLYCGG